MIKIEHFIFNAFQARCSVVWDEAGNCAIVDPGCSTPEETDTLKNFISSKGLTPVCIMLTHCHFDHMCGMSELAKEYEIPVYAHANEIHTLDQANPYICKALDLPLPQTFPIIKTISEAAIPSRHVSIYGGDIIDVGSLRFEVLETPGHTTGGVCFLERKEKVLFSGDTLFAGAIGRSDFPGGDYDMLMKSIFEKIISLDSDIDVIPGHGPLTDIATEGMTNPFLQPFNEPYNE